MDGLVITLLSVILGVASLAVISAKEQQSQNCNPKTCTSSQEQSENQLSFFQRTIDDPVSLFTFLLVAVASGQLGLFWWQLDIINRSVKDANITAMAAVRAATAAEKAGDIERAWLFFDGLDFSDATNVTVGSVVYSKGTALTVKWCNGGRSPAINIATRRKYEIIADGADTPTFDPASFNKGFGGIVGPNRQIPGDTSFIPSSEMADVINRKNVVIYYCRVEYNDVFNPNTLRHSEITIQIGYYGQKQDEFGQGQNMYSIAFVGPQNSST